MRLFQWLDIRPGEIKPALCSFLSAFSIIGFAVLARSLREGFYLSVFAVETLPYITGAVVILALPAVALFTHFLSRYSAKSLLVYVALLTVFAWC